MNTDISEEGEGSSSIGATRSEIDERERYPLRVLLIDDGAAHSSAFQRLSLSVPDGRYILERVATHIEAYAAIDAGTHDVYLLSHLVGSRTGFDLLSWVRERGRRIPIVFLASAGDHGTGVTAVAAGASCYLVENSIESGILEHSLNQAVQQTHTLLKLSDAGIDVDHGTSTRTQLLFSIAERVRVPGAAILEVTSRSSSTSSSAGLPAHILESFGKIEDKAGALLTLANDINDLSMLEAGHFTFSAETFSVRGLVSHMRQVIGAASRGRNPTISVEIAPNVPDSVIGDPARLRLVMVSIIETVLSRSSSDRAVLKVQVDHMNPGSVILQFTARADSRTHPDGRGKGGSGAPSRVDSDSIAAPESESLGFSVAHETVSRMGGSVTVNRSRTHTASVQFTVQLQISEAPRSALSHVDERTPLEGPILVISDDVNSRRSIMSSLNNADLPVVVSPSVNAWNASRLTSESGMILPSLVVIESDADAFTVCDQFDAQVSGAVPMVVVVGTGKRGDATRCRERGVRGYLPRPLDSRDLIDVIRSSMALVAAGDTTTLVTRHWVREGRPSLHVLVVDDSTTNRFLLTRMLEQRGHSTEIACDGSEAIEANQRYSFDVVLMDVVMPVIDGLEATRLIRGMQGGPVIRPLIIGVSAFAGQANIERALDAGMDGFLAKPVQPDDLFAVIEQSKPPAPPSPAG